MRGEREGRGKKRSMWDTLCVFPTNGRTMRRKKGTQGEEKGRRVVRSSNMTSENQKVKREETEIFRGGNLGKS